MKPGQPRAAHGVAAGRGPPHAWHS